MARRTASRGTSPSSEFASGTLPGVRGDLRTAVPNLQISLRNLPQIWSAFAADQLQRTAMGGVPDRIAQSPVMLTSLPNRSFIGQIAFVDSWVFPLTETTRSRLCRALQPIVETFLGVGVTATIEEHELVAVRKDGTFERVVSLPTVEAAAKGARGRQAINLGPLTLMPLGDSEAPDAPEVSPLLTVFPRETVVSSESELRRALTFFVDIVRCYLSLAEAELHRTVPRDNLTIDGAMIPPSPKEATPKGFLQMQSEMSRKDLERLLQPTDIAQVRFADVLGQAEAVRVMKQLSRQIHARDQMAQWGATLPIGVLLVGPPGNGKTMLAAAAANEAQAAFLSAKVSHIFRGLWGETEQRADWLVEIAREKAREHPSRVCILFLDEVDALAGSRDGIGSFNTGRGALNLLLSNLSGLGGDRSVVVVATTNLPDILDKAFLDRMDLRVAVPLPNEAARIEILSGRMQAHNGRLSKPAFGGVDPRRIAQITDGMSGRQLAALLNMAVAEKALWQDEKKRRPLPVSTDDLITIIRTRGDELADLQGVIKGFRA